MQVQPLTEAPARAPKLDFLWLELTNRCNLQCAHCYAGSGPYGGDDDRLSEDDYLGLIAEGAAVGCRQIQFIGGEPTLNGSLGTLIKRAVECSYEMIEVFTNLVRLDDALLNNFRANGVRVATSFYSSDPDIHDQITLTAGSFRRTVANIRRVLAAGVPLRVGVVEMEANKGAYENTARFLAGLGVENISCDQVREFGRAQTGKCCSMNELCGHCATDILAIGPDGIVAPCIMSKQWSVGSVLSDRLFDILCSSKLADTREQISVATSGPSGFCQPECGPQRPLCIPQCGPSSECFPCGPKGQEKCVPNHNCGPGR